MTSERRPADLLQHSQQVEHTDAAIQQDAVSPTLSLGASSPKRRARSPLFTQKSHVLELGLSRTVFRGISSRPSSDDATAALRQLLQTVVLS